MFDVVALGELLIDFTPVGHSTTGNVVFERNPGGAPANVLAAVARFGGAAAFLGMVGKDQFGQFLKGVLEENNIDVSGLKFSQEVNTTLAFVHLDNAGDRSFSFYRNPGADMMFSESEINYDVIRASKVFHFGSISMTHEPVRSATETAIRFAKSNGLIVSYDPNYRPPLWPGVEVAKKYITAGLAAADILKISQEEMELLTGTHNLVDGAALLCELGIKVVLVTLGPEGCYYKYPGGRGKVDGYSVRTLDTTGAGDAFLGAFLHKISGMKLTDITSLSVNEFTSLVDFANAAGALATTKTGAIPALPPLDEVNRLRGY